MSAEVIRHGALDMQVCVPADWTDEMVRAFAEGQYPCGTTNGRQIRREGDEMLRGASERGACASIAGHVHVVLDA
jgi:hypothetical protein